MLVTLFARESSKTQSVSCRLVRSPNAGNIVVSRCEWARGSSGDAKRSLSASFGAHAPHVLALSRCEGILGLRVDAIAAVPGRLRSCEVAALRTVRSRAEFGADGASGATCQACSVRVPNAHHA